MRYSIVLLVLLVSCGPKKQVYPPYRVEQLNELEQEILMEELLDSMRVEAEQNLVKHCELREEYIIAYCGPRSELYFKNANDKISMNNKDISIEEIPQQIHRFYNFNRSLPENEAEAKILDPNYEGLNYPFYGKRSKKEIREAIEHERELMKAARDSGYAEYVEFHRKFIEQLEYKLMLCTLLKRDTLTEIEEGSSIIVTDETIDGGFSKVSHQIIKGIYEVRNTLSKEYFGSSYLDLFYRSTRLNDTLSLKQLEAINALQNVIIFDMEYIESHHLAACMPIQVESKE